MIINLVGFNNSTVFSPNLRGCFNGIETKKVALLILNLGKWYCGYKRKDGSIKILEL